MPSVIRGFVKGYTSPTKKRFVRAFKDFHIGARASTDSCRL